MFVDEMGASTSLTTLYAWAWRGNRARTKVSRNREPNTTLLASMTHNGIGLCVAVVGSTTCEVFEAYIEQVLSTALKPGQVVVMDNLSRIELPEETKARLREIQALGDWAKDGNKEARRELRRALCQSWPQVVAKFLDFGRRGQAILASSSHQYYGATFTSGRPKDETLPVTYGNIDSLKGASMADEKERASVGGVV